MKQRKNSQKIMQVSSKGDIPSTIISVLLLWQVSEARHLHPQLDHPNSLSSSVGSVTPSSSFDSSAGKTNTDVPRNSIDNQEI